jgi:hypothetical protein
MSGPLVPHAGPAPYPVAGETPALPRLRAGARQIAPPSVIEMSVIGKAILLLSSRAAVKWGQPTF